MHVRIPLSALALAAALALAPPGAGALPLLSEVFYDASGGDDGKTFVEIVAVPGFVLDGLVLEGINGADGSSGPSLVLSGSVPDDGLFVVADQASGGGSAVPGADLIAPFELQNGPDSVVLRSGDTVLDALGYGVFAPGEVFAGEGSAAPDAPGGSSLARHVADVDTGDNAADFGVLETPTPGSAPRSLPEPGSALLGAVAAVLLVGRRTPRTGS
jgi:hypothetical protein